MIEIKDNIDELMLLVEGFRSSKRFKKLIDFVGKFHYLAPFNAMLVQMQKPGAEFVFTARAWINKYNRQPKPNAQQLITLYRFGPIQVMFDYDDTEPISSRMGCASKDDLMNEWYSTLTKASGKVNPDDWNRLIQNLPAYGIRFDSEFNAASTFGGYLLKNNSYEIDIKVNKNVTQRYLAPFVLSVNKNQSLEAKFHTVCHELGHLFCRHLFYDNSVERNISEEACEFEAETVAWLVCKRHGINNPSEEYLATYAPNGVIPACSVETVMRAVAEIEKMMTKKVSVDKTSWYKYDKEFKKAVDNIKKDRIKR